jgi:pilus assembly protein Flp/PilA
VAARSFQTQARAALTLQFQIDFRGAREMIKRFLRDETGLELSEYAVAAALIAIAAVGAFQLLGGNIKTAIENLSGKIPTTAP